MGARLFTEEMKLKCTLLYDNRGDSQITVKVCSVGHQLTVTFIIDSFVDYFIDESIVGLRAGQ